MNGKVNSKIVLILLSFIALVSAILLISGYIQPAYPKNETAECITDENCGVGGCSGEVCTTLSKSKEIVTICVWKPEYECLKKTSCGCIKGKCKWEENQAYKECMEGIK